MVDGEKFDKRLKSAVDRLESASAEKSVWTRSLADAVLDLFRRQQTFTADELREAIRAGAKAPIEIAGSEMRIDLSRKASEVAIKHLNDALRARESDSGQ